MRRASWLAGVAVLAAAPASAQEIHVDPSVKVRVLKRGNYVRRCGDKGSCPVDKYLRMVELSWSTGCTVRGDGVRHHWEVGLRSAVRPGARRDPENFEGTPAVVDGAYAPVVKPSNASVEPLDEVFREFPEALAAFADGYRPRGATLRMGVLPGSVLAAHIGASCEDSEFVGLDSDIVTVRPRAQILGYPNLRPGRVTRIDFDLSGNASSLVRRTGRGFSGAILRVSGSGIRTKRRLSARDVARGQTFLRVRPSARGRVNAWITLSGVRSANTVALTSR